MRGAPHRRSGRGRSRLRTELGVSRLLLAALLGGCASAPGATRPRADDVLRVAVAQYAIRGDATAEAIAARVDALAADAAAGGAELLVLPELFVLDAWPLTSTASETEITRRIAREVTPRVRARLQAAARAHGVAILGGSAPELRDGRLFNTARLYLADGTEHAQDKVHPTAWGRRVGMTPGASVEVFDAPWGRTAILICYDIEFASLSVALEPAAPEVWLVPSMTESEAGRHRVRWTAQARAVEHHAFVVVAPTVGAPADDWRHFGRAAVLTPQDSGWPGVLAEARSGRPGLVFADLDLGALRDSRARTAFYPARDAR
jgi:predicted amidohydrolase